MADLTTTAYVTLGLLSTRDWSAYELAEQVGRGMRDIWAWADRQRYNTAKRLVELGLIDARSEPTGRRPRTIYSINDRGLEALRSWLAEPPRPPALEFEGMVRVLIADQGSIADLRQDIEGIAAHARAQQAVYAAFAEHMLATGGGTFPERAHLFALANRFMVGQYSHVIEWASWALAEIEDWPDTTEPAHTHADRTRAILERAGDHDAD